MRLCRRRTLQRKRCVLGSRLGDTKKESLPSVRGWGFVAVRHEGKTGEGEKRIWLLTTHADSEQVQDYRKRCSPFKRRGTLSSKGGDEKGDQRHRRKEKGLV